MNTNQEEKKDNDLVDVNQNSDTNSTNEASGQEEMSENKQLDSDEIIAKGSENEEISSGEEISSDEGKRSKTIKTLVIAVLLLLPIAYIFYKTTGNSSSPQPAATQAQGIDIAAYESAANSNPTFSNLLNLSNAYINSNMAAKAIEPLNKAIALNPKSASAYSNLSLAYTILQNYKAGIENGEKALQLDSTFTLAKNNLNWAKGEQKKELDVIKQLDKTPEKERTSFYYIGKGLHYLKLQEFDKAIETWNVLLVKEPGNSGALINIGVAYLSKGQFDEAIKSFQKAVDANPNDQLAKNNLGWALSEKNKALNEKNKIGAEQKK